MERWLEKTELTKSSIWDNGYIIVILEVQASTKSVNPVFHKSDSVYYPQVFVAPCDQYLKLIDTGLHSDVTLLVKESEFKVHKAILATRCSYFEAMFGQGFIEFKISKVVIDNVEPSVFKNILEFIYGGKFPSEWNESAVKLFIAADCFGLEALAAECEKHLIKNITA